MLNKILGFLRRHDMIQPGDRVICAVSGGADSMALLFAMYLLREKLEISLEAAHFDHGLRGDESRRDAQFVQDFCRGYDIPLHLGSGTVTAGEKGLEAAARDARYAFLRALPGKIATAHTANDNAETVLMHMLRGTGLKGLGGITPVGSGLIRPMLSVTREEILAFLEEYAIAYVEDSSNGTDHFLRNRIRHHVMPLLQAENPKFAENVSAMALRLREDEKILSELTEEAPITVSALRQMPPARRSRVISRFLRECGVREPEKAHIALVEGLVFSNRPSARADLPGGITVTRNYDKLEAEKEYPAVPCMELAVPGITRIPQLGIQVACTLVASGSCSQECFCLPVSGKLRIRPRKAGDTIRLSGGTKSVKKLFIDRKIPASQRQSVPILEDDRGILGVWGIGAAVDRQKEAGSMVEIRVSPIPR